MHNEKKKALWVDFILPFLSANIDLLSCASIIELTRPDSIPFLEGPVLKSLNGKSPFSKTNNVMYFICWVTGGHFIRGFYCIDLPFFNSCFAIIVLSFYHCLLTFCLPFLISNYESKLSFILLSNALCSYAFHSFRF